MPSKRPNGSAKERWREPTEDDPRRRIIRTDEEMRNFWIQIRITRLEHTEFYRYSRARKATMSYMVREALKICYPEIFANTNRYIASPKKKVEQYDGPAQMLHSYVDGSTKILDIPVEIAPLDNDEDIE